ncbi:MAG: chemotaxis-specific protein-glutamate methyltransferase CheB [Bdellovibrionia bacterium]
MKVFIVDDSSVFRTQISKALADVEGIEVVGTASNGKLALQKLSLMNVDVVTLDMEMPEISGREVIKEMKLRGIHSRVIIFSAQSAQGAESALIALNEGADDFVPKPTGSFSSIDEVAELIRKSLVPKIQQFVSKFGRNSNTRMVQSNSSPALPAFSSPLSVARSSPSALPKKELSKFQPSVLVIGSSTGGPAALDKIFSGLKEPVNVPILITQHMPPVFTASLAKRLAEVSGIPAAEARSGEFLEPNRIYVAPGDFHMLLRLQDSRPAILVTKDAQRNSVRPAVDYLFETAAQVFSHRCLGLVLTGMGEDGLAGSIEIRKKGGAVMIQDEESCVVFGMPGAIYHANEYDSMGSLEVITAKLNRLIKPPISGGVK